MKINNLFQHKSISTIAAIIAGLIFLSFVYIYCQHSLESKAYDFLIKLSSKSYGSPEIVNVVIDDESLSKIGRWPWNRSYYADIFEYLENIDDAKAIAFDSIITSDSQGDKQFFERINKLNKLTFGVFFSQKSDEKSASSKLFAQKFSLNANDTRNSKYIKSNEYKGISYLLKGVIENSSSIGSVLVSSDIDGVIRKSEPFFYCNGKYYPSLSLALLANLKNDKNIKITNKKIEMAGTQIPVYSAKKPHAFIKWYRPLPDDKMASHKSYSAWKVIESYKNIQKGAAPLIEPGTFKDKIVIVGATATALNDIKATPLGVFYPGVDIQATLADNVINNEFVKKAPLSVNYFILVVLAIVVGLSVLYLSPLYSALAVLISMLGYFELCIFSYGHNYAIDVITPQVLIFCFLTIGYCYKYFLEGNSKRQVEQVMAKYVSKDVMKSVLKDIDGSKLGGKREEITVLFADIRKFTSISENLDPEQLSEILNLYFSEMEPIITKHKGIINKFMGDALLAVFGAPICNENHATDAVLCSVEMLAKVKELQRKWINEGKPKIEIGIGINTGQAFVGNVGSEERMEYTAIGDTVNLANRIESQNRLYNTKLLISAYTYEKVKDMVDTIKISSVEVRNRQESIHIYEIIDLLPTKK